MASKRRIRRKACEGKKRHTSKENAEIAVRLTRKKFGGGMWCSYQCPFCKQWHVGHIPGKLRGKRHQ